MTRPQSLFAAVARGPVLGRPWPRRLLFGLLILGLLVFSVFPQQYRAVVTMSPSDPSTLGLQGALGQLGAFNTVFGNQAQVELSLKVARGTGVRERVIEQLSLVKRLGKENEISASRWLDSEVGIRALRGGIIQVELKSGDSDLAIAIVGAFADATRAQLAEVSVRQTAYKRQVLEKLVDTASLRMAKAQVAYDAFRLQRRVLEPNYELGTITVRIETLRTAIKAREVQLQSARQFATDQNIEIRQLTAELVALRSQLRRTESRTIATSDNLGSAVDASVRLIKIERELANASSLYVSYKRFLEGTAVEDLTATASVRILEPPFIDTARQYRLVPLSFAVVLALLLLAIEAQPLRRPVGVAQRASAT